MGLLISFTVPRANAEAPITPPTAAVKPVMEQTTPEQYARYVDALYNLHGTLYNTLLHESSGWVNGQSEYPSKTGPNGREDSWGICQINLPGHRDITRDQALDWKWCIDWSARQFKAGNANMWTEYRLLYGGE